MCVPILTLIPDGVSAFFCEIVFKQGVVHSLGLLGKKRIMLQSTRWPLLCRQYRVNQMQPEYNLQRKIFIDTIVFSSFNAESGFGLEAELWIIGWHYAALAPGVPLISFS
ncbi:hypothetical protein ZEAMMB73_Zm00001d042347 [Zea mays]|jgi:hypothetical protein|uniref:Uncharacterized protein n=1 Tax=Zea mays TaxID=4577 RepID=C0HGS9_MAIZE|nr:unknown [Zea mays]ONM35112.1 hypothetical protein ZEAMMB73_Zm00001d042347 [Zea mays]ONM35113.1 hypothetical protein ZEAMMB73_Zm00001d042347 [Zea mays]ONM35116.1 hypothetical protein ZEAMMB73_Zm00001d042347 [Zea mays]ONM35119.1 hypothetical protein ZEAMMB73_Zm00001d042347 [Zea mays]